MTQFNYSIVKNPEIFQQNRLPAHADYPYFEQENLGWEDESDCRKSLNGRWKFSYADNYAETIPEFWKTDVDVSGWDEITVPGHIETQGYDHPAYVNTQYPWDGHEEIRPGQVPERHNPTGSYVTFFEVPEKAKGRKLFISFQGVESGMALWLNGTYIGYSEDSFTPSEFDLTDALVEGKNRLAVQVFKWTAGSWGESQDFFRFSGIFRDVYLYWKPEIHVEDLRIRSEVSEDLTSAVVNVWYRLTGKGELRAVLSRNGTLVEERRKLFPENTVTVNGAEFYEGEFEMKVQRPVLWSAESPNLYDMTLQTYTAEGKESEIVLEKVGLRRFEIKDSILYLNGKRIVFHGVDRHEFGNEEGRALKPETTWHDLVTMKRNNINAVRTSHYPNANTFYRMCDQLGLYIIDEANFESHGAWDAIERGHEDISFAIPGDRPEFLELMKDRVRSMYERDKNRPCVLLWSLGNESYGGSDLLACTKMLHELDPGRPIHYEGVAHDRRYNDTSDVESTMYATVEDIKGFLAEHRDKPYILCEYSHAMGNSCGAIHKYMDLVEEEPLFQGGFIWDYIDQCLTKTDRYGREFQGYGGDFGERPTDYNFSGNGIVYGENREPSPKMQEVKHAYQAVRFTFGEGESLVSHEMKPFYPENMEPLQGGPQIVVPSDGKISVHIKNGFLFTNLNSFETQVDLHKEGEPLESHFLRIDCEPEESTDFVLPVVIPEDGAEYTVTVKLLLAQNTDWGEEGLEMAWGQAVVLPIAEKKHAAGKMEVIHGYDNTGVRGENFEILFSTLHGGLVSYKFNGREVFSDIPKPNTWRAPTDNDIANLLVFRSGQWKAAGLYATTKYMGGRRATDYTIRESGEVVEVSFTYHLPTNPVTDCIVCYEVRPNGWIGVDVKMGASDVIGQLPEFSMQFAVDADYDNLCWYGLGADETYIDRCHAKLGIYRNKAADNLAKYLKPQECGNKMSVRKAALTDETGHGVVFETEGLQFSALPYTPQMLENAKHPQELPLPLNTYVRIGVQQGVGGDDTWGAPVHPEFLLDNTKELHLHFSFCGV
ncbi:MAG: glycoside hydrolase family 2 TIM barrel-domain containing protein [Eubacteriales bacterium]|nr:glycoside hydrolase family 2 TIM barrel-domain containing protein [Eubacteriales bacterium]